MTAPAVRDYLRALSADPAGPADADLLARFARTRDEAAFELLVWRHAALVQRVCRSVLRDRHAAEDAAQAAFLVLARKAGTFAGRGTIVGWLYRVARRAAVRLAKQRARLPGPLSHPDRLAAVEVPDAPAAAEDAARLWAEIDRLPDRYRVPVLLCHFDGLTHPEAARRLGWPVGTVAGRLSRARTRLGRRLVKLGVGLPAVGGAVCLTPAAVVASVTRNAITFAAGRVDPSMPPVVVSLADGVTRAMSAYPIKVAAAAVLACGLAAGVWGVGPGAIDDKAAPAGAAEVATPAPPKPADALTRVKVLRQLKQIGLAIHNYEAAYGHLPRDIADRDGKPLLSWRVALLPFLDRGGLYGSFKLDEPWDSPTNGKVGSVTPAVYQLPGRDGGDGRTSFQGLAGPGTLFEPGKKRLLVHVTDGLSNTLAVVVGGPPVPWTKPGGLPFDPKAPKPPPSAYPNLLFAVGADGTPWRLPPTGLDPAVYRMMAQINDGFPLPDLDALAPPQPPLTKEDEELAAGLTKANVGFARQVEKLSAERGKLLAARPPRDADLEDLVQENARLIRLVQELEADIKRLKAEAERTKGGPGKK